MIKKEYVAPEMKLLILEQSDIITGSGNTSDGKPGSGGGVNDGIFDGGWED